MNITPIPSLSVSLYHCWWVGPRLPQGHCAQLEWTQPHHYPGLSEIVMLASWKTGRTTVFN